ncbi:hypothetical protein DPMN_037343 [Dreissena polymorpha]|uniref:Uncharacterized protein n=1 Tax=Dreissena polymorpha TaxID=45954 RepID=A0A9D4MAT0_DREPO|nr:hypothetical protein DPMN_037343 [Dreissena polymorpha]
MLALRIDGSSINVCSLSFRQSIEYILHFHASHVKQQCMFTVIVFNSFPDNIQFKRSKPAIRPGGPTLQSDRPQSLRSIPDKNPKAGATPGRQELKRCCSVSVRNFAYSSSTTQKHT